MWIFVILHGCSNSGLDRASTDSADSTAPAGLADCPWVGEWKLDSIECGRGFGEYTAWHDFHNGATLAIEHDPAGGCAIEATVTGAECQRFEEWHFDVPVGIDVAMTSEGITDCKPNKCKFDPADDECKPGDLAGPRSLRIEEDASGALTAIALLAETAPGCPIDVYTTWKLK